MKVLLLHPGQDLQSGAWQQQRWDWVVDLGWSGDAAYVAARRNLGACFSALSRIMAPDAQRSRLRSVFCELRGHLVDSHGIDWLELFSIIPYSQLNELVMMEELSTQIPAGAEIWTSQPNRLAATLARLRKQNIQPLSDGPRPHPLPAKLRALSTLKSSQLLQIALDKYDTDYRLRRYCSGYPASVKGPVTLLPTGYVNVSRTQIALARAMPDIDFLQCTTRASGVLSPIPGNVATTRLAAYLPKLFLNRSDGEADSILLRWPAVEQCLRETDALMNAAFDAGVFSAFPTFLKAAIRVRDGWLRLFASEPVQSVVSSDENSPFTRIPALLAKSRGLPTINLDHGALNMTFALRPAISATHLVQGRMAEDYLLNYCGARVQIERGSLEQPRTTRDDQALRDSIIFFSEPYELNGGRTSDLYREVFPRLCAVARATRKRPILKLHPFESEAGRKRILKAVLSAEDRPLIQVRSGPLTSDLLRHAWCGLTVESSVAVECALQGIPCFTCAWFDNSWFQYGAQFARFGAAHPLRIPGEIDIIPSLVERKHLRQENTNPDKRADLSYPLDTRPLKSILLGRKAVHQSLTTSCA